MRGARRRNYTRAVARGRSRNEALAEFQGCGGKLTTAELVSVAAFGRIVSVAAFDIPVTFGGIQVRHPETVLYIDEGPHV